MSQQKMLFAVCFSAGLIALVAGQSFDPSKCSSGAQQTLTSFQSSMTSTFQEFANEVASKGSSAFDINGFQQSAQQLLQQYTSLADTSSGIDLQNMLSKGSELMQSQAALMSYFTNSSAGLGLFTTYMSFTSKVMSQYTTMVSTIGSQCLPSGR